MPLAAYEAGAVEGNDERNRHALLAEIFGLDHHGVGAERMTDQHDRTVLAGLVSCGDVVGERLPLGVVVDGGDDAARLQLGREVVHAERENVQQTAQKIDMARAAAARGRAAGLRGFSGAAMAGSDAGAAAGLADAWLVAASLVAIWLAAGRVPERVKAIAIAAAMACKRNLVIIAAKLPSSVKKAPGLAPQRARARFDL